MIAPDVRYVRCGDAALAVQFDEAPSALLSQRIAALHAALRISPPAGMIEGIPGLTSLTILFEPGSAALESIERDVQRHLADAPQAFSARHWRLPVCYEADLAPDLEYVAQQSGLHASEVVQAHSARPCTVYLLGFSPGLPYMGEIDPRLALPRRAEPRVKVPAGSVAIAMSYTAIYPQATAGGWHIIGATPVPLFDIARDPPALLSPADTVQFEPIARAGFDRLKHEYADGLRLRSDD